MVREEVYTLLFPSPTAPDTAVCDDVSFDVSNDVSDLLFTFDQLDQRVIDKGVQE